MDFIVSVFKYINDAGSSVFMPIIVCLIGIVMGAGIGKSIRGGLTVGCGLLGLGLATGLMGDMAAAVASMSKRFGLSLGTLDVGWPAAAAIAMGTQVGTLIIPICLVVNIVMIVTSTTQTIDIDVWNYWHFAFTGPLVAIVTDSLPLGIPGVSLPHGFTTAFAPIAMAVNWVIEKVPGLRDVDFTLDG